MAILTILEEMIYKDPIHIPPAGSVSGNIIYLGIVFPETLPGKNIRYTSLLGYINEKAINVIDRHNVYGYNILVFSTCCLLFCVCCLVVVV